MFSRLASWWVRFVRTHYTPRLAIQYSWTGLKIYYHRDDELIAPKALSLHWGLSENDMYLGRFVWNGVEVLVELPTPNHIMDSRAYITYLGHRFPISDDNSVVTELYPEGATYHYTNTEYVGRDAGLSFWARLSPWERGIEIPTPEQIRTRLRLAEIHNELERRKSATPGKE